MNVSAPMPTMPVPRQRCMAMKKIRSRDEVPTWVADLLCDPDRGNKPHLYYGGTDKGWPYLGRLHWKALIQYAYLPSEAVAIAFASFEQRLPTITPSKSHIVKDSGVPKRTADMAVDVLTWLGFVDVERRDGGNRYFLAFPLLDTTRVISKPHVSITPLHRALKEVVAGEMPHAADAKVLDLDVLRSPPSDATDTVKSPGRFAEAWEVYPGDHRGREATARRAWDAAAQTITEDEACPPGDAEGVLLAATKHLAWEVRDTGKTQYAPGPTKFFAVDGPWRDYRPGGAKDPNRPVVYLDGVQQ